MKYKIDLLSSEVITLQEAQKNSSKHHFRQRCHAIELLGSQKSVSYVSDLFKVRQETVYQWIKRWNIMGIVGLMILPGRGLKAPLVDLLNEPTTDSIDLIKKKLPSTPKS